MRCCYLRGSPLLESLEWGGFEATRIPGFLASWSMRESFLGNGNVVVMEIKIGKCKFRVDFKLR